MPVSKYGEPARTWHEALPVGNGRIGALVHGGTDSELLHLNEGSVWSGRAASIEKPEVLQNLPRLRELLFAGKHAEAEALAKKHLTTAPRPDYGSFQPLGDLVLHLLGGSARPGGDDGHLLDGEGRILGAAQIEIGGQPATAQTIMKYQTSERCPSAQPERLKRAR